MFRITRIKIPPTRLSSYHFGFRHFNLPRTRNSPRRVFFGAGVSAGILTFGQSYLAKNNSKSPFYSGHRCYSERRPGMGVNVLGLHAGVGGGRDIYCYPYP